MGQVINESPAAEPRFKARGVDKHFGPVQALTQVDLDLYAGQVTALCGDNGAGKSVAVAKAVMWNSKLVMLDEPTAALGVVQTRMVLDLVRRLRDRGLAVMVISHNLNDVFEVADRIAVVHLGRMVAQGRASAFDRQSVVDYMTTGASSRTGQRTD